MDFLEELSKVDPTDIIPESTISFTEQSNYVADSIVENYNNFMQSVGIEELDSYEKYGIELIYTGESADSIVSKIRQLHLNNFATIKNQYNKIYTEFKEQLESSNLLSEMNLDNIKEDIIVGKVHTFFDFDKINFAESTKNLCDTIQESELSNDSVLLIENTICSSISGLECNTLKEMTSNLKKELIGESITVNKEFLIKNKELIENIVFSNKILNDIEESYNNQKEVYNYFIESVESIKENSDSLNEMNYWNKLTTLSESVMNSCFSTTFDVYNRMLNEYKNIILKVNQLSENSKEGPIEDKDSDDLRDGKEKYNSNNVEGEKQEPVGAALESNDFVVDIKPSYSDLLTGIIATANDD